VTVDRGEQGNEAVGGEEDVPHGRAGLTEHIGKEKLNLLAACQQMLTISGGERGE